MWKCVKAGPNFPCQAPLIPRMVAREPSIFHGASHENVDEWLSRYDQISDFNQWGPVLRLQYVGMYLDGIARDWFLNLHPQPITFDGFSTELLNAFRHPNHVFMLQEELRNRIQGPTESPVSHCHAVLSLCRKVNVLMADDLKIQNMLHGLRPASFFQRVFSSVTPLMTVNDFIGLVKREHQSDILAQAKSDPPVAGTSTALNLLSHPTAPSNAPPTGPWADLDVFKKQMLEGMESLKKVMKEEIRKEVRTELGRERKRATNANAVEPAGSGERAPKNLRTEDGRPICNHCTGEGHIHRYCYYRGRTPPPKRRKLPAIQDAPSTSGGSSN